MSSAARVSSVDPSALAGWTAGTWTIDPAHTVVAFAARHLMSRVRGTFSQVNGKIVTSPDRGLCSATAAVTLSSVSTGNEMRDNHLRSADFFDIGHSPTMTFASTGLRQENGAWVLAGDLTIRAVTRPVEFEVEFLGVDATGLQGETGSVSPPVAPSCAAISASPLAWPQIPRSSSVTRWTSPSTFRLSSTLNWRLTCHK
jgi:polyisoprenoid-binding protein YceI